MQGIQMCCITPELQGGVRNRQTHRGCTYFGNSGTQLALALAQEQMKSQKQAQNQGLQLGTNQGQAHRVGDLVASMEQGREELAGGGGGVRDQLWGWGQQGGRHMVDGPPHPGWTMAPGPPRGGAGDTLSTTGRGKGTHQREEEM